MVTSQQGVFIKGNAFTLRQTVRIMETTEQYHPWSVQLAHKI